MHHIGWTHSAALASAMEYSIPKYGLSPATRAGVLIVLGGFGVLAIVIGVVVGWPSIVHGGGQGTPIAGILLASVGVLLLATGVWSQFGTRVLSVAVGESGLTIRSLNRPDFVLSWSDSQIDVLVTRNVARNLSGPSTESYILQPQASRAFGLYIDIPLECYQEVQASATGAGCALTRSENHIPRSSIVSYSTRIRRRSSVGRPG